MAYRLTPNGVEDDGREDAQEILDFICSVEIEPKEFLGFIASETDFSHEDFQVLTEMFYSYAKMKKGEQ